MKKVPSLIAAAIIATSPSFASAQNVAASASRGVSGAPAMVPTIGLPSVAPSASMLAPTALTVSPSLAAPSAALTPSMLPAALVPAASPVALKPVSAPAAAAERMKDATAALAAMPDMSKASSADSRNAGASLELALTGERRAASVADAPFASGVDAALAETVKAKAQVVAGIKAEIAKVIVGQEEMIESIITAMIASEHVLLEGVPGVAKTQTVKAFSDAVKGDFQRVQGTPDKLPSDLLGAEILQEDPATGQKAIKLEKGPVFTNILLVDEINRMMPKTQAALLEAMAEGNATIGRNTLPLPKPFMVLATQNPIEQEGVYRLPEAQQDRFMFKVLVPRPTQAQLKTIMERFAKKEGAPRASQITSLDEMVEIRKVAEQIHVDEAIMDYITSIVEATHNPGKFGVEAKDAIEGGASPRAGIFLLKAAKINALIEGRAYVSPKDVREVAARVLRHRLSLTYQAHNLTTDQVVEAILAKVPVPKPSGKVEAALQPSDKK
ncbi:MAG: AAA family ATPase [Elusimicrobiota bacterium]|nr:MAG: AAA family ATPase [Elusimicrobiota bacterium]